MTKYILIFSATYLLALVAFLILSEMLDIDSSANIVVLGLSAFMTSSIFVNKHGRAPARAERRVLVWGSYLAALFISGMLMFGYLTLTADGQSFVPQLREIALWYWITALAIVTVVSAVVLSFCYGTLAKQYSSHRNS